MEQLWQLWLTVDEPVGTVLGVVVVLCLIRQNLWAWPLGVAYVLASITVLWDARLYANLSLHVLGFLPMNLYGWYFWVFGRAPDQGVLPVTNAPRRQLVVLLVLWAIGTAVLGAAFQRYTDAALPYWDNALLVGSLIAMWLTARKNLENWAFWLVIDVVSVAVYWIQGLGLYAALYFVYLAMAVAGWRAWRQSMPSDTADAAEAPATLT